MSLRQLHVLLIQLLVAVLEILLHSVVRHIERLQPHRLCGGSAVVHALRGCFLARQNVATLHAPLERSYWYKKENRLRSHWFSLKEEVTRSSYFGFPNMLMLNCIVCCSMPHMQSRSVTSITAGAC